MKNFRLIFAISVLLAVACRNECRNTNPVFDSAQPGSPAYNTELMHAIRSGKDLDYHLVRFEEKGQVPYMHIQVAGDGICATAIVAVLQPDEDVAGIIDKKGISYGGAELKGLTLTLDTQTKVLVYSGMDWILD